jgi:hypothetical protein
MIEIKKYHRTRQAPKIISTNSCRSLDTSIPHPVQMIPNQICHPTDVLYDNTMSRSLSLLNSYFDALSHSGDSKWMKTLSVIQLPIRPSRKIVVGRRVKLWEIYHKPQNNGLPYAQDRRQYFTFANKSTEWSIPDLSLTLCLIHRSEYRTKDSIWEEELTNSLLQANLSYSVVEDVWEDSPRLFYLA